MRFGISSSREARFRSTRWRTSDRHSGPRLILGASARSTTSDLNLAKDLLASSPELLDAEQLARVSARVGELGDEGRFPLTFDADWVQWRTNLGSLFTDDGDGDGR